MEQWKDIQGFEGIYRVSNIGRIKTLTREVSKKMFGGSVCKYIRFGKIMAPDLVDGYHQITLSKKGAKKRFKVHRLVALVFVDNPDNKPFVNHIDADRTNNHFQNLEWCTSKENAQHCANLGRVSNNLPHQRGEQINTAKLKEEDVVQIKRSGKSNAELGRIFGVSKAAIRFIKIGKNWSHVTA